jgi:hypothetical protein
VRQSSPLFFSIAGREVGRIIAVLFCAGRRVPPVWDSSRSTSVTGGMRLAAGAADKRCPRRPKPWWAAIVSRAVVGRRRNRRHRGAKPFTNHVNHTPHGPEHRRRTNCYLAGNSSEVIG